MFRLILLIFLFLYFTGNFFYAFVISYLPYKNGQNINIYSISKTFSGNTINDFLNNQSLTGTSINIDNFGQIDIEKKYIESYSGVNLILPFRSNHRFGERIEIFLPIINDTGNISSNDLIFSGITLKNKQNIIKNGISYIDFGINYDKIYTQEQLNNLKTDNLKTIYLNKLYLISSNSGGTLKYNLR